MKIRISEIKNIIREEVSLEKVKILESTINKLNSSIELNESIVASVIDLFVSGKFKRRAENLKDSAEYKELMQQAKVSAESLSKLTNRLKEKIEEYESLVTSLEKEGVPVKMGMDSAQIWNAVKKKHSDLIKRYNLTRK